MSSILLLLFAALIAVFSLDRRVTAQFEGRRWTLPARVYAQPVDLYVGQTLSAERLGFELDRLGYLALRAANRPGTYRRRGQRVEVYVRAFRFSDELQPARLLKLAFDGDRIAELVDAKGVDIPVYRLDPLLIGSIFPVHGEDRIVVSPDQVPAMLPEALKAVEDRKFDQHHGVNFSAILRALFANVRAGQVEQGGSTLTQQLVKNYFLDSRRTLRRKIEEAVMAVILEARFEKADIMNAYINEIYLGQDGQRAVHGFGLASQFYFGKPLSELELHEVALMVAIVRGPSYYDPRRHPERALERRNLVLKLLAAQGVIAVDDARSASARPLGITEPSRQGAGYYPAFLDLVRRQLRRDYKEEDLTEAGLVVFSTLDPLLQNRAERALTAELERLEKSGRKGAKGLEGVIVATSPQTGEVTAIVGGRQASFDGFNRALDARRPIGSLAKPMVYLAALETGEYSPVSYLADEPVELKLPNGDTWRPANFTKEVNGPVPMVRALTQSLNLATVNLGLEVGLERVADTYVQLGLEKKPNAYPVDAARRGEPEPARSRADVQHARERRVPVAASRRAGSAGRAEQAAQGAGARGRAGRGRGCRLRARSDADRGDESRHRSPGAQGSLAEPGRRRQDRYLERLPRQLVRGILGLASAHRVGRSRRQQPDRTHGNDRGAGCMVPTDGFDRHVVVRTADAGVIGGSLGRLLHGRGDLAVLQRCRAQPAVPRRCAAPAQHDLPAVFR